MSPEWEGAARERVGRGWSRGRGGLRILYFITKTPAPQFQGLTGVRNAYGGENKEGEGEDGRQSHLRWGWH